LLTRRGLARPRFSSALIGNKIFGQLRRLPIVFRKQNRAALIHCVDRMQNFF
jgi:hypothetical protein